MNKRIKKLWIAALRVGKYKQGYGALRAKDEFCCLGVLCDLYIKAHPDSGNWEKNDINSYSFQGSMGTPPPTVVSWAGLSGDDNPEVASPRAVSDYTKGEIAPLAGLNDAGLKFMEIADIIETQL